MEQKMFTVDMLLGILKTTDRTPLHLSRDGQKLVITVQDQKRVPDLVSDQSYTTTGIPHGMVRSRILVVDISSGSAEEPFPHESTSWGAQWSPDGTKLAAYVQYKGQACLGIWNRMNGQYTLYPHILVRPFFGFEVPQWMSDNKFVLIKLMATNSQKKNSPMTDGQTGPATVFSFTPGATLDKSSLPGWADGYICDLARVDITTGETQRLVKNWSVMGWKMSPNDRFVAVLRYIDADQTRQQFYFNIMIVSVENGTSSLVAERVPQSYGICFNWSPDSRFIAYTTQERGDRPRLFVVPSDGSRTPQELGNQIEAFKLLQADEISPRWSHYGQHIYCLTQRGCWEFATDGSTQRHLALLTNYSIISWIQPPTAATLSLSSRNELLYLVSNPQTRDTGIVAMNMKTGESIVRIELPVYAGWSPFKMEMSSDGFMYLFLEESNHPARLWQFHDECQYHKQLYVLNPQLHDVALGTSRLLAYRTLDGKQGHATLLLPAGYKEENPVPVIVVVYGGSTPSASLHCFGISHDILHGQLLAAHGYAVLFPDIALDDHNPMRQLPGQVIPAINHLIDLGIADPKRIGLMGQSYGGYCVLSLLVQTTLFAAAVANAGFYNLVSVYLSLRKNGKDGWLGWCESGQGRMQGTLWEKSDIYRENSPIFYLNQVQTPLLLTCGSQDLVPPTQAEEVFVGLRRLDKRVELRRYTGEGHWPGRWSEQSYQDLCARIFYWFDEYLR